MIAYYNEHDPRAAAWLRELIQQGHLAAGVVDERDVRTIRPADLAGFTQCHFFAGIGGWSLALRLAGWPDDRPVWTGSCPCQPFSAAGAGAGFDDERHLWPHWHYLIQQRRPGVIFGEQVASKDGLSWLDLVHADLEATHYTFGAFDLCAAGVGAPHIRQRLWFVADARSEGLPPRERLAAERTGRREEGRAVEQRGSAPDAGLGDTSGRGCQRANDGRGTHWSDSEWLHCADGISRPVEPGSFPLAHGLPARVGRLRGYGNAIVPEVASTFISAYLDTLTQ